MLMSDVKDILGVEGTVKEPPKPKGKDKKKALPSTLGINGHEIPGPVSEGPTNPLLASMRKYGKKHVRKWVWDEFTNSARDDALKLKHWRRVGPLEGDYLFARLNRHESVPEFSDIEYEMVLQSETWTKEETKYLLKLAFQYSMIWPVVCDRYEYPGVTRTLDDIKDRYYYIDDTIKALHGYEGPLVCFDKAAEVDRKRRLEKYLYRSEEEIKEEEDILKELDRIRKQDTEYLAEKKLAEFKRVGLALSHGDVMLADHRIKAKALQSARRSMFGSPEATSPTKLVENRMSVEDIAAFGLSTRPIRPNPAIGNFSLASELIDTSAVSHITKQPMIAKTLDYYMPNCAHTYTRDFSRSMHEFRSRIHCISEAKGALLTLFAEYNRLRESASSFGIETESIPAQYSATHFEASRPAHVPYESSRHSIYSLLYPTLPIGNGYRSNPQGIPSRSNNCTPAYPTDIISRPRRVSEHHERPSPTPPTHMSSRRSRGRGVGGFALRGRGRGFEGGGGGGGRGRSIIVLHPRTSTSAVGRISIASRGVRAGGARSLPRGRGGRGARGVAPSSPPARPSRLSAPRNFFSPDNKSR